MPASYEICIKLASIDQGDDFETGRGILFSSAKLNRSFLPANFAQNSSSRHGAMILISGARAAIDSSKRT